MSNKDVIESLDGTEIAVIGMSGRFAGAANIDTYWRNLRDGVEAITRYSDDELRAAGVDEALLRDPNYIKSGMHLDNMEMFDAAFFDFSPRDAAILDPQHRHFLECSWEAMEHAGYDPARFDGPIGVYGGSGHNIYLAFNLLTNPQLLKSVGFFLLRHTGNDKDFLTTRVSYLLNLKGPSVNVQTACSTSLVAIHMAGQSLLSGECDMALAGGATINLPHRQGYMYHEGEITSPDGHCRAFDAAAEGTIFGSGAGVVVLRRMADAIEAGDTIHAVILGSAINNDGAGKVNYLAPSVDGQAAAVAEAMAMANVNPETITYIETHGTGTRIGDPIEVSALTQAFRAGTSKTGFCGIGSVKTNIGHTDTAAGVASFMKAVLALKHRQIPASLNFTAPNPMIDFADSPFYVNTELKDWCANQGQPRRAGVNSLGVGGTNAHVILEEAPQLQPSSESRPWQLLLLSAKSAAALDNMTINLSEYLRQNPPLNLADAAYTLQVGRQQFGYRRALVCRSTGDGATGLESLDRKRVFSARPGDSQPSTVFMFPGGGAQYPNMARELYEQEPVYRTEVERCLTLFNEDAKRRGREETRSFVASSPHSSSPPVELKRLMFPDDSPPSNSPHREDDSFASPPKGGIEEGRKSAAAELERPSLALPALFITEYALAKLWQSWGVEPESMIGHSMGEYTAACLSGVLSVEDALAIVTLRGKLFETLPEGGMLSVSLPEGEVRPLLVEGANIAVINGPDMCVVSGPVAAISQMEQVLAQTDADYRRIKIAVAAHSAMLEPILEEFGRRLSTVQFNPPNIPFVSNVTGTWITPQEATDPAYWVRHLRHTVRFADGLGTLLADTPERLFLELGPGQTLSTLARMHPHFRREQTALASLRHPQDETSDLQFLLTSLGRLWLAGVEPDWTAFYRYERRYRVPLPTYPFEHQRHWIEPGGSLGGEATQPVQVALKKLPNLDDWFYQPVWQQVDLPAKADSEPKTWLIFSDELGLGKAISHYLQTNGHQVIQVMVGTHFAQLDERNFVINPYSRADYEALTKILVEQKQLPQRLVHLWPVNIPTGSRMESFYTNQDLGFNSLLFLAQTLGNEELAKPLHFTVISNGMHSIKDEPLLYPEKAIVLGPCQVIPREYPQITCQSIDIALFETGKLSPGRAGQLVSVLMPEIATLSTEPVVAYRRGTRWVRRFEPAQVESPVENRLREQGVYLITGGFGGIGLVMAKYLAQTVKARLVLVGRSGLPPREEWSNHLRIPGTVSDRIQAVQSLEAMGAEVLPLAADVTNWEQMEAAVDQTCKQFGTIHGVIHAAGLLADGLIQFKSPDAVNAVMSPKVSGALLLDELLEAGKIKPDFFVLFSSTSSVLGIPGQIDYSGANAFLNAFAQSKTDTYAVAINWGMWQQVGMAVKAARQLGLVTDESPVGEAVNHPLLDTCLVNTVDRRVYVSQISTARHWILNEHRLRQGDALIPGTGYLEWAKAAFENGESSGPVEIKDLVFVSPLNVQEKETKEVRTILQQDDAGFSFTVVSKLTGTVGDDVQWQEHVHGAVSSGKMVSRKIDIQEIAARCNIYETTESGGGDVTKQETHMDFGPRWQNMKQALFGTGEALALLELPTAYVSDVEQYTLHPALMDTATAFALPLIEGYQTSTNLYVPLSYKQVAVYHPLPQKIYSYVCLKETSLNTPSFDVTILDEHGTVLVEIVEFTMMQVDTLAMAGSNTTQHINNHRPKHQTNYADDTPRLLQHALSEGILPAEGAEAFARILGNKVSPQIIVTSLDFNQLVKQVEVDYAPKQEESGFKLLRPSNLETGYEPPRNDIEKSLVKLWEELLGIDKIGIRDNFFELGGHSLIAVRLFARVKKLYAVNLSLATLFDVPTIAQFAELLQAELGESENQTQTPLKQKAEWSPLVAIQPQGNKLPFFCVHGIHGNVLIFYHLTRHLGQGQPFYALQAQGVDGKQPAIDSLPDMAAHYIKEIKTVQPDGPYYLGGFSMGGEVAFEMAQQLHRQGEQVAILVMFDTYEPGYVRGAGGKTAGFVPMHPVTVSKVKSQNRLTRFISRSNKGKLASIKGWTESQRNRIYANSGYLYLWLGRPMPQRVTELYLEKMHSRALLNYQPQPYSGRITLFRADTTLSFQTAAPSMRWETLAEQGVDLHVLHAPHEIIDEPYVQVVVQKLIACLEQVKHQ